MFLISTFKNLYIRLIKILDPFATQIQALVLVAIRLWIAIVFWKSGLTKLTNWDSTILLFENEYKLPLLSPAFAAYSATATEIIASVMLVVGLGARIAAIALLCMTLVIQLTYQSHVDHLIWALFLAAILIQGAGRYSWDFFIRRKYMGEKERVGPGSTFLAIIAVTILTLIALHEILAIKGSLKPWVESWDMFWYGKKMAVDK